MSSVSGAATYRRWRARRVWLRDPARALKLLAPDIRAGADGDPEALSLASWLLLTFSRDEPGAEQAARTALRGAGDGRFASAALSAVLLNRGAYDEAIEVLEAAAARHPSIPWYELTICDALEEAGRTAEAETRLERRRARRCAGTPSSGSRACRWSAVTGTARAGGSASCSPSPPTTSSTHRTT